MPPKRGDKEEFGTCRHIKCRDFPVNDEVFVAGLGKWFMWCALADGQPMGKFGKHAAFQIGTLAECDGAFYIVADNDDYFKSVPANMLRTINDRKSLRLGGYKRGR